MSELQQPFFNGIDWSVMINDVEVILKPHETYSGISFEQINFNSLNLFFCTFINCQFVACELINTDCSHSNFNKVRFSECDMSNFVLIFGKLANCELSSCDLSLARINHADMYQTKIWDCQLTDTRIFATNINYSLLSDCSIDGLYFEDVIVFMSNLRNISAISRPLRISRTHFEKTNLIKVDAHHAKFVDVTWGSSSLITCNFWKSVLKSVKFTSSKICSSGFNESKIIDTLFVTTLVNANRLRLVSFIYCVFERCDLINSVMESADLSTTIFDETHFADNGLGGGTDYPTIFP